MNTTTPVSTPASLTFAQSLFARGTDCLGYPEVFKALGIPWNSIPVMPFHEQELTRARSLNQFLILQIDKMADGSLLTMKALRDQCENKLEDGKLLYDTDWYEKSSTQDFFLKETPILGWKLVGKEVIPGTLGQNYLEQTETLANYLKNEVYKDQVLPPAYENSIKEFESEKKKLLKLMGSDWQKAAEALAALKLNQYFRETPVEVLYRHIVYTTVNKERLLPSTYTWTKSRSSYGYLVLLGRGDAGGVRVGDGLPGISSSDLGLCFSRGGDPVES